MLQDQIADYMQNKSREEQVQYSNKNTFSPKGLLYLEVCWRPCMLSSV